MPLDTIPLPLGGFDDREALTLDGQKSPNIQNVRLRRNRITKRPGIQRINRGAGARTSALAGFDDINEPVVQLLSFPKDGNSIAVYNFQSDSWGSPLPLAPAPGEVALNDFQHWSVVNTLNLVVWAATNHQLRVYAPVVSAYNPLVPIPLPGNAQVLQHDLPFRLGAMVLLAFANRVIAVRVDENGTLFPTRVRWCANGQITKWNPTNDGAGFLDVRETTNMPLTGAFVLNAQAYLTKARDIIAFVSTGDSTKPFVAQPLNQGRGYIAPHSIATSDYIAYGVGADNVYAWDGSSLQAIGDPIWETLASAVVFDQPDVGHLQRIVGTFYKRRSEYWLYAPDQLDKNGTPVTEPVLFIYDTKENKWYQDKLTPGLRAEWFTPVLPVDVWPATGPTPPNRPREQMTFCTDSNFYWFGDGDELRQTAFPPIPTDAVLHNGGTAPIPIESFIETKDYEPQEFNKGQAKATLQKLNSLQEVRIQAPPGTRLEVWMSPDQGVNWVKEEAVSNEYGVAVAYFLNTFSTLRLRIYARSSQPLNWKGMVQVKWQPAGWNPSLA